MKTRFAIGLVVVVLLTIVVVVVSRRSAPEPEPQRAGGVGSVSRADAAGEAPESGPVRTKGRAELNPGSPEKPVASDEESSAKTIRRMGDNQAGKAVMNRGVEIAVTVLYGDFIKTLNLSGDETDYLDELLGRELSDQQELGLKMVGVAEEERQALVEEMNRRTETNDEAIKDFLNSAEDYQRYEDYKDRLPEHQQIDGLRSTMNSMGVLLDKETEARLIEAMHQVRKDDAGPDFLGPDAIEEVAKGGYEEAFRKSWDARQEALLPMVSGILSPDQLEAFQENQKQMRAAKLMGLRMIEKSMQEQKSPAE